MIEKVIQTWKSTTILLIVSVQSGWMLPHSSHAAPPEIQKCTDTNVQYPMPATWKSEYEQFVSERRDPIKEALREVAKEGYYLARDMKDRDAVEERIKASKRFIAIVPQAEQLTVNLLAFHREFLKRNGYTPENVKRAEDCFIKGMDLAAKKDRVNSHDMFRKVVVARRAYVRAGLRKLEILFENWNMVQRASGFSEPSFKDRSVQSSYVEATNTFDEAEHCYNQMLIKEGLKPNPYTPEDEKYLPQIDCDVLYQ